MNKKLPAGVSEEFMSQLNTMDTGDIKNLIVRLQVHKQEAEAMKEAPGYVQAKDAWQMVSGPVRETATSLKNRLKMAVERLKEKGGA